jgi:DHA2 family multidrug resistance protein
MSEHAYPDPARRRLITATIITATLMAALDATIANVALPHIQGSVSASSEEVTWVLTSYIVATAIFMPLTGWLATRYGRKKVMIASVIAFTLASGLCGLATNLDELVILRFLQGAAGAGLVPLSQAILLDINPPERHGPAMAVFGMGAVVGPIAGPVLGGWLTENLDWRWCFYINLPVGILTVIGLLLFVDETEPDRRSRLDMFGFAMLAIAVGALQLVLDRGQQQDWFSSTEICIEAVTAVFCLYAFIVHVLTVPHPFVSLRIFQDRNFAFGMLFGFFVGVALLGVLALLPSMMEHLMGYPVQLTGLIMSPRGIGSLLSMAVVGQLVRRFDQRLLVAIGFIITGISLYRMSGFSLAMGPWEILVSGLLAGIGNGMAFVPLAAIAFATLAPEMRNEASVINSLVRNLGSAVGISVLQTMNYRSQAIVHSRLTEAIRPDSAALQMHFPGFDFQAPDMIAALNGEISRQASMVSYIDGYWALAITIFATVPFILLLRPPKQSRDTDPAIVVHVE